jgi:hypothetical protein
MAEMKPETKIERLIAKMKPLADWYASNKPNVRVIRVAPDELKLLVDNPAAALPNGVFVEGSTVKWRTFEIKSA